MLGTAEGVSSPPETGYNNSAMYTRTSGLQPSFPIECAPRGRSTASCLTRQAGRPHLLPLACGAPATSRPWMLARLPGLSHRLRALHLPERLQAHLLHPTQALWMIGKSHRETQTRKKVPWRKNCTEQDDLKDALLRHAQK